MEVHDYPRRTIRIIDQLAPRISPKHRPFVLSARLAGAWDIAIMELVGALSEEDVVITTAQKDALRELVAYLEEDPTYLVRIRTSD